ncbi:MAG TPA: hypothetical protein VHK28_01740 [Candidatus Limnocylindria bacterium]|nr:hypothetical protein [Candidatus Limnocylindria bacterium]
MVASAPPQLDEATVAWLFDTQEPAVRRLARRELLHASSPDDDQAVLDGPIVAALLDGQQPDGGFGVGPYTKWTGAHWRLVSLVELGVPAGEPRAVAAAESVLAWLTGAAHRRNVPVVNGLARRCGSQEGNALAVASRLGLAGDERTRLLASSLIEWQWPDGGWNCDRRPEAHRSSFHESLVPTWGLHEYACATNDTDAAAAARRGAELFLEHRLFRRLADGEPIHREWLTMHWPPYWHYDVLQAMVVLARMGLAADPRTADALELISSRRRQDGRWQASTRWWRPPPSTRMPEVLDWRWDDTADRMVTLRALSVLRAGAAG